MSSRMGFLDAFYDHSNNNREISKELEEDNRSSTKNPNYSKHGKEISFPIKIKTIFTSLINRYLGNKEGGAADRFPDWRESRILVTPKGHGTTPVLANNNIGSVTLNLKSRTVEHTLYFLESNEVRSSVAVIEFEDRKSDTRWIY